MTGTLLPFIIFVISICFHILPANSKDKAMPKEAFTGTVRSACLDTIPKETWIPFKRYGNLMLVQGWLNGQSTGMLFDTGASGCLFSTAQLKALGIKSPMGQPTGCVAGVGGNKSTPAWMTYGSLRIGSIERRHFPIQINDNPLNFPLLGVNFFQGLEYTIDQQAKVIQFKKITNSANSLSPLTSKACITVDSSSHYVYCLPFVEEDGGIIVLAKIDGKECKMLLDTGTDLCLFTNAQVKQMGLKPHFTGQVLNAKGAAGLMRAPLCSFEQAEFGPIRGQFVCLITDQAALPRPLLGQNFLKDWQLTVDHSRHVIKFIRK